MKLKRRLLFSMNNKFCVSLEAARLLKEKGYDRECVAYYQHEIFHPYSVNLFGLRTYNKNDAPDYMEQYSAPTKAEAIDWLESKGIVVIVDTSLSDETWIYSIYREGEHVYDSIISKEPHFPTRLGAEEAAIIKALELL